jgi:hypothetical protein
VRIQAAAKRGDGSDGGGAEAIGDGIPFGIAAAWRYGTVEIPIAPAVGSIWGISPDLPASRILALT